MSPVDAPSPPAAPAVAGRLVPECVQCGFCLPTCPTYDVLGTEADSPRGRLHLMEALAQGRLEPNAAALRHLDLCLGCRACETACPSGVRYGERLEATRARWRGASARPAATRRLERLLLAAMTLPPAVQRAGAATARALLRAPLLGTFARRAARASWAPTGLAAGLALLELPAPAIPRLPYVTPAVGRQRRRVALLLGCVGRWMHGDVNAATVRLLARAGCEVVVPPAQGCCGALHAHAGDRIGARRRARRNIAAFEVSGRLDHVVSNAAGCGSTVREWGALLADDGDWAARAASFAERTRDALELLHELGLPAPEREVDDVVAYHDACHLAHVQGVRAAPRRLLERIPGLTLVPLAEADRCCGSAGIYSLLHPEEADRIRKPKLQRLVESGARTVAAANPGCLQHLAAGAARDGHDLRVRHPLLILDDTYG